MRHAGTFEVMEDRIMKKSIEQSRCSKVVRRTCNCLMVRLWCLVFVSLCLIGTQGNVMGQPINGAATTTQNKDNYDVFNTWFWNQNSGVYDGVDVSTANFTEAEIRAITEAVQYWTDVLKPYGELIQKDPATGEPVINPFTGEPVRLTLPRISVAWMDGGNAASYNAFGISNVDGLRVTPIQHIIADGQETGYNFGPYIGPNHSHALLVFGVDDFKNRVSPMSQLGGIAGGDIRSVMIHELGHSLGVSSGSNLDIDDVNYPYSIYGIFSDPLSRWDTHLRDNNGNPAYPGEPIGHNPTPNNVTVFDVGDIHSNILVNPSKPTFVGENTMQVYYDGVSDLMRRYENRYGVPLQGLTYGGDPFGWTFNGGGTFSHINTSNSLMSWQNYRNYPYFIEVELATLQDIGYDGIARRNHFGRSYYTNGDGTLTYNATPFMDWDYVNKIYTGAPNTSTYGVGLHLFGSNWNILQTGHLRADGTAGAGIRIDGINNKVTIARSVLVTGGLDQTLNEHGMIVDESENGIGLLVAYGKNHVIVNQGTIKANGKGGTAVRFDFGEAVIGETRGSYYFNPVSTLGPEGYTVPEVAFVAKDELNGPLVKAFDITGAVIGTSYKNSSTPVVRHARRESRMIIRGEADGIDDRFSDNDLFDNIVRIYTDGLLSLPYSGDVSPSPLRNLEYNRPLIQADSDLEGPNPDLSTLIVNKRDGSAIIVYENAFPNIADTAWVPDPTDDIGDHVFRVDPDLYRSDRIDVTDYRFVPERDAEGNPLFDGIGNPLGEYLHVVVKTEITLTHLGDGTFVRIDINRDPDDIANLGRITFPTLTKENFYLNHRENENYYGEDFVTYVYNEAERRWVIQQHDPDITFIFGDNLGGLTSLIRPRPEDEDGLRSDDGYIHDTAANYELIYNRVDINLNNEFFNLLDDYLSERLDDGLIDNYYINGVDHIYLGSRFGDNCLYALRLEDDPLYDPNKLWTRFVSADQDIIVIPGGGGAILIGNTAHVDKINVMKGASIEGDIISLYTNRTVVDDEGNVLATGAGAQGRKTTLSFGFKPDADGNATSQSDSDFHFIFKDNINYWEGFERAYVNGYGDYNVATWGDYNYDPLLGWVSLPSYLIGSGEYLHVKGDRFDTGQIGKIDLHFAGGYTEFRPENVTEYHRYYVNSVTIDRNAIFALEIGGGVANPKVPELILMNNYTDPDSRTATFINNGRFVGNGRVLVGGDSGYSASGTIRNNGAIAPGSLNGAEVGRLDLYGNLAFSDTASYEVTISNQLDDNGIGISDRIYVSEGPILETKVLPKNGVIVSAQGRVTLNGTLKLNLLPEPIVNDTVEYQIINANSFSGNFTKYEVNVGFLDLIPISQTDLTVNHTPVVIHPHTEFTPYGGGYYLQTYNAVVYISRDTSYFENSAKTHNEKSVAKAIDNSMIDSPKVAFRLGDKGNSEKNMRDIYNQIGAPVRANAAMMNLWTPSEQLFPHVGWGNGQMNTDHRGKVDWETMARGKAKMLGQTPYRGRDGSLWGETYHNAFNTETDGNSAGYRFNRTGFMVGGEWNLTPYSSVGGFASYGNGHLTQLSDRVESNDYQVGLYFLCAPFNALEMKTYIGTGYQDYDMKRYVSNPNISGVKTDGTPVTGIHDRYLSRTDGNTFNLSFEMTRPLELHPMFILRPTIGVDLQHLWQHKFSDTTDESAARAEERIFGLKYDKMYYNRSLFRVGFSSESSGPRGGWHWRAFYVTKMDGANYPDFSARFSSGGKKFSVRGVDLGSNYLNLGLGSNVWLDSDRSTSLFFNYDANIYTASKKTFNHLVSLGLIQNF